MAIDIDRSMALALMAQDKAPEIWAGARKQSVALNIFPHYPMGKKEKVFPMIQTLPAATNGSAFVTGDRGVKPKMQVSWSNRVMTAEEIPGIIVIPESVFEDADTPIWAQVEPTILDYVADNIDMAIFSGIGAPESWPTGGLAGVASRAGNVLDLSTYLATGDAADGVDLGGAFLELGGYVEEDGFDPRAYVMKKSMRRSLRNARDLNGNPIMVAGLASNSGLPEVWDTPYYVPLNDSFDTGYEALAIDTRYGLIGDRIDMQWKALDQATLTSIINVGGTDVRQVDTSLAEEDCIGLRFRLRLGFTYMDPTTIEGGTGACPFALLKD